MSECLHRYARAPHTSTGLHASATIHIVFHSFSASALDCIKMCASANGVFGKCAYSKRLLPIAAARQSDINKLHISMDPPSLSFIFEDEFCIWRAFVLDSEPNFQFNLQFPADISWRFIDVLLECR